MPSLAQLFDAHRTLLVLDAASARVQVGWLSPHETSWASEDDEAGKALFGSLDTLFKNAPTDRSIAAAGAFVFCAGPGSILGIRTAATAIRTWRTLHPQTPAYSYQSLALLAHGLAPPQLSLIADARRDHWHLQRLGQPLRQIPSSELADAKGPLAMPEGFRHWTTPPPHLARVPYDLETLFAADGIKDANLFAPAPEPDAFLHNEVTYKTWSPQIHRAPSA